VSARCYPFGDNSATWARFLQPEHPPVAVAKQQIDRGAEQACENQTYPFLGRPRTGVVICSRFSKNSASLSCFVAASNEPRDAFDAGPYGIAIQQRLIAEAPMFLRPGGWLAIEFGAEQDRQVKALFWRARRYATPSFVPDSSGVPRVALARRL
jgi:hypothetical protein